MLVERCGLATVSIDSLIFAIGGIDCKGKSLKLVEMYDIRTDRWEFTTSLIYERYGLAAVSCSDGIFVMGGGSKIPEILFVNG